MRIAVLDSTAVCDTGPGSPAYFSRFVLSRLHAQGHEILCSPSFDEDLCNEADLVLTEWANKEAFDAAASGVCKRLVIRMRGFDAHGPLDRLQWENVSALVHESSFLWDFTMERFPEIIGEKFRHIQHIIPSGIDIAGTVYQHRDEPDHPIVALVARTTADKGYQLAFEYARQRPEVEFHVTTALSESNPRLTAYLQSTKPGNVTIHGTVDTAKWLNQIGATHILSCSIWETLGYTIAEGMATGCKPLIHDAPGTSVNWPAEYRWQSFDDLDKLLYGSFDSRDYRAYAEHHFNERELSQKFIDLVTALPARQALDVRTRNYEYRKYVIKTVTTARKDLTIDVSSVATLAEQFRQRWPVHDRYAEDRYGVACGMAGAYLVRNDLENAAVWACRATLDGAWPDALCLLGEIADRRGDLEEAVRWYEAANALDDPPRRCRLDGLIDEREKRLVELHNKGVPLRREPVPFKAAVVVTVRNAEKWIERCLVSIASQSVSMRCVVIDDVSTDKTAEIARRFVATDSRFVLIENTERKWQAQNTVEGARLATDNPDYSPSPSHASDWLLSGALTEIAACYDHGAWMTYGNFVTSSGKRSHIGAYPQRIARAGDFASWTWQATAPRSFKRFLLDELKDEDFMLDGEWPKVAGDVCVLLPMLELACERAIPIVEPIYVYNDETPDSDHKQDAGEQVRVRDRLMDRPRKSRLER